MTLARSLAPTARPRFLSCAIALLLAAIALPVPAQDRPRDPDRLLQQIVQSEGEAFWTAVTAVEALGKDALPVVEAGLKRSEAKARIGCAKVLYSQFEKKAEAVRALIAVMKDRVPAAQILAAETLILLVRNDYDYGDTEVLGDELLEILDSTSDARAKIAISRSLYFVSGNTAGTRELKDLLASADPAVREAAAFALADTGNFDAAERALEELARVPTPRGERARLYLEIKRLADYNEKRQLPVASTPSKYDFKVLEEVMDLIFSQYADAADPDLTPQKLVDAAAHGIGGSLDKFSAFLDPKERRKLKEGIEMKYAGIGAHVSAKGGWLTIERPVFGGPVDKAGLRPLDQIREVEGKSTWQKDLDDVVVGLKGDPGTTVTLKVYRRGWTEPRDYVITRESLQIDTAKATILPGKIGYIQITSFGNTTSEELARCLTTLRGGGITSLILDVRGNPGGYLKGACEVVDQFLEADKLIVTTRDRNGKIIDSLFTERPDQIDLPITILINGGSASAAEIFSGCLHDHKRGFLIGERSFGKGSVQHIIPLKATREEAAMRLTVHKYFLPGGRTPHKEPGKEGEGGIAPDLEVKPPRPDFWKDAEFARILDSGELDKWWSANFPANKDTFRKLADFDGWDLSRYPGHDNFVAGVKTKLEPDEVRQLLRQHVRRMIAWEYKVEMLADWEDDVQLQAAIVESLKRGGGTAGAFDEYRKFADRTFEVEKTGVNDKGGESTKR